MTRRSASTAFGTRGLLWPVAAAGRLCTETGAGARIDGGGGGGAAGPGGCDRVAGTSGLPCCLSIRFGHTGARTLRRQLRHRPLVARSRSAVIVTRDRHAARVRHGQRALPDSPGTVGGTDRQARRGCTACADIHPAVTARRLLPMYPVCCYLSIRFGFPSPRLRSLCPTLIPPTLIPGPLPRNAQDKAARSDSADRRSSPADRDPTKRSTRWRHGEQIRENWRVPYRHTICTWNNCHACFLLS